MAPAILGAAGVWLTLAGAGVGALVVAAGLVRGRSGRAPGPRLDGRLFAPVVLGGALLAVGAME
jgi:hypothetical protein